MLIYPPDLYKGHQFSSYMLEAFSSRRSGSKHHAQDTPGVMSRPPRAPKHGMVDPSYANNWIFPLVRLSALANGLEMAVGGHGGRSISPTSLAEVRDACFGDST